VILTGRAAKLKGRPREAARPLEAESYLLSSETAGRAQVFIRYGVLLRSVVGIFLTAAVVATLFTWWTPNTFLPSASMDQLSVALATQSSQGAAPPLVPPTPTEPPPLVNIGIVSGHRGLHRTTGLPDPGAICPDGLTEQEVNETVAWQVVDLLEGHGYTVDLLDEFDERLNGYRALAMVSIHADSCEYINDMATGFKVASFADSSTPEEDARLVDCLTRHYAGTTGLSFHPSVTFDMTQYHTFLEIAPGTPGAIIEIGFLYLDRELLTAHPDVVALGIARGVLCYVRGEDPVPLGEESQLSPTPSPTS
jgi:N-acetylmuramoyl-L-alanine amidase